MFDEHNDIQQKNIELLLDGYWDGNLPPIMKMQELYQFAKRIIKDIDDDKYSDFEKQNGYITGFKDTTSPSYIYNDGIESITFFDFKKNGALREMQIPNLKYYCSFIYNSLAAYNNLFGKLYNESKFSTYVSHSNSYLMFDELFYTYTDYDGNEEYITGGIFAVNNNKKTAQLAYEENNVRYLDKMGSRLYSVKVDIESFYPNVYTHYLSKIKEREPFKSNIVCNEYFDFLDYYNMKTNNNQTKGIATGVFSSTVSAELLMLCVDYEIKQVLGDEMEYIRYVDDMTFFSDSLEKIYSKLPDIQKVLNKYRLRINHNKTEANKSIYNMSYVDIYELKKRFQFLISEMPVVLNKDIFYNIKGYVARAYDADRKSEIKAFLTMLKTAIHKKRLIFDDGLINFEKHFTAYMLQLSSIEPLFASRCYRVIIEILELSKDKEVYKSIIQELYIKSDFINKTYYDSVLQIWHYYVLSLYDDGFDVKKFLDTYKSGEVNPIILASFVKSGDGKNTDIFKYIKNLYSAYENKEGEPSYWMRSIMFSKWWLPLAMIYMKDNKNYFKFYESKNYHEIYKFMRTEESLAVEVKEAKG